MNRIKSAVLSAIGLVIALTCIGFFATFGLMIIGFFVALAIIGTVVTGLSSLIQGRLHTTAA